LCRCDYSQRNKSSKNFITTNMANTIILNLELPPTLPHGWKGKVAKALSVHKNTVTNALKAGNGDTYNRIMTTAKQMYGTPIKTMLPDEKETKCHI